MPACLSVVQKRTASIVDSAVELSLSAPAQCLIRHIAIAVVHHLLILVSKIPLRLACSQEVCLSISRRTSQASSSIIYLLLRRVAESQVPFQPHHVSHKPSVTSSRTLVRNRQDHGSHSLSSVFPKASTASVSWTLSASAYLDAGKRTFYASGSNRRHWCRKWWGLFRCAGKRARRIRAR